MTDMSNLYDRPLDLVPPPQQLSLQNAYWRPRSEWRMFDAERGRAWAFTASARSAKKLLQRAPRLKTKQAESYALSTFSDGAVGVAHDSAGVLRSHTTLNQLVQISKDRPVPLVEIQDWPDLAIRGIHLDLKYMMHRKDYLLRWLDSLASYKINALLLEYEDKFPYRRHPVLRHPAAFTEKELQRFLAHARSLHLRVVPLIQTLGHVEYILKHAEFAHLRKNGFHTEYDTSHPGTWPLIRSILDEVLEFHELDEWFHVGGDECWHLSQEKPGVRARLYSEHMAKVLGHVMKRGKRPMLWDDMMRLLPDKERATALKRLPKETILGYWNYDSTPSRPKQAEALDPKRATEPSKNFDRQKVWAEYRRAGFDTIAIPCHAWGPIVPYYARHTVPNTLAMIRDAVQFDCPGLINSQWASFHCPIPLQDYGIALTGDRSWKLARTDARDFDEAYCRLTLGLSDRTFVEALYQMDGMLEMPTNLGRGVHLPHWYYMDAVLHYPNAHADRLKYGPAAPLEQVDFARIVRKKLALLKKSPLRAASIRGLERFRDQGVGALRLLRGIRGDVHRSRDLLALVTWLAQFRVVAAERMLALATRGSRARLASVLQESRQLRRQMRRVYLRFIDTSDYPGEEASLFEGEETLLARRTGSPNR